MFNKKRIKELEELLENEKNLYKHLSNIYEQIQSNTNQLIKIENKISPTPIPNFDMSAIAFATMLQQFPKKQYCGVDRACKKYYMVPSSEIDNVAHHMPVLQINEINKNKMGKKLKPCDCEDMATASLLNEQGIGHNDESIVVEPNVVVLKMGHASIRISMQRFKIFAKWYLAEQDLM